MARTIAVQIEIQGAKDINEVEVALRKVNKERADLLAKQQKGGVLSDEEKTKLTQVTAQSVALSEEKRNLNMQYKNEIRNQTALSGSYNGLVAQTALLRQKLRELPDAFSSTNKEAERLKAQILANTNQLKKFDESIGQNFRNVGNYKEAFSSVLSSLSGSGGAFGVAIGGIKGLNTAMAANPAGAVVAALVALVGILGQNAQVADFFAAVMAGLNKAVSIAIDFVIDFGKSLFKAFENPKQAILDLVTLIKDNLLNRFKAFGVIASAIADGDIKKMANGFVQLTTGVEGAIDKVEKFGKTIAKAGKEGFEAERQYDELKTTIAKLNAQIDDNKNKSEELLFLSHDVNRSNKERLKLIADAIALEVKNSEISVTLAEKELEAEQLKLKGKVLSNEEEAHLIELNQKVKNAAAEADIARASQTRRASRLIKGDLKEEGKEVKELGLLYEELHDVQINFFDKLVDKNEKLKESLDSLDIGFDKEKVNNEFDIFNEALRKGLLNGEITENEFKIRSLERDKELINIRLQDKELEVSEKLKLENDLLEKEKQIKDLAHQEDLKRIQEEKKKREQLFNFIESAANGVFANIAASNQKSLNNQLAAAGNNAAQRARIEKEFAEKDRKLKKTQVLIAGALAVARAFYDYKYPVSLAIAALAGLQVAAQVAVIDAQEFAEGGMLKGKSHAQGGIPFTVDGQGGFEAEGGEALINKRSTKMFRPILSAINKAGGGVAFERGGILNKFQNGGQIPNVFRLGADVQDQRISFEKTNELIDSINSRIDRIEVINVASKTNKLAKRVENLNFQF